MTIVENAADKAWAPGVELPQVTRDMFAAFESGRLAYATSLDAPTITGLFRGLLGGAKMRAKTLGAEPSALQAINPDGLDITIQNGVMVAAYQGPIRTKAFGIATTAEADLKAHYGNHPDLHTIQLGEFSVGVRKAGFTTQVDPGDPRVADTRAFLAEPGPQLVEMIGSQFTWIKPGTDIEIGFYGFEIQDDGLRAWFTRALTPTTRP